MHLGNKGRGRKSASLSVSPWQSMQSSRSSPIRHLPDLICQNSIQARGTAFTTDRDGLRLIQGWPWHWWGPLTVNRMGALTARSRAPWQALPGRKVRVSRQTLESNGSQSGVPRPAAGNLEMQILWLPPQISRIRNWKWGWAASVLTSPPRDSEALWSLRTTAGLHLPPLGWMHKGELRGEQIGSCESKQGQRRRELWAATNAMMRP